jgi:UDP-N-acetylglucosamine 2-epimerase (non-hydrolysing)
MGAKLNRIKILTVIGTRPEAIKLAPVIKELNSRSEEFINIICLTAQHREMLDQVLNIFDIQPDHDLDLMIPNQTLSQLSSIIIERLDYVVSKENPDVILVQGDTTSALCGALVAFYHQIKVGHIEAGLRTNSKYTPFPEEMNRRLIGQLAEYHFAPTESSRKSLLKEGVTESSIHVTGNTIVDALLWMVKKIKNTSPSLPKNLVDSLNGKRLILVTGHRRESFGKGLEEICMAILEIVTRFPEILIVYPVHFNPNVRSQVYKLLGENKKIHLIDPLPYDSFIWLMNKSEIVITDSGGIQEEAPSLNKPVLITRTLTERIEGVQSGSAFLVGLERSSIVQGLERLLSNKKSYPGITDLKNPYGDGKASKRIVNILSGITSS